VILQDITATADLTRSPCIIISNNSLHLITLVVVLTLFLHGLCQVSSLVQWMPMMDDLARAAEAIQGMNNKAPMDGMRCVTGQRHPQEDAPQFILT
jgi:hypothetical protein